MPARDSGETFQLGRPCHNCGQDQWRERATGGYVCVPCDREGSKRRAQKRRADRAYRLWEAAKQRAEQNLTDFHITVEDVRAVWPYNGCCPVFGMPLRAGDGFSHDGSPTLDRINPEWGYAPGNIAVISLKANRAKGNLTADELERIVRWMRTTGLR